jgi:hypothetical protein
MTSVFVPPISIPILIVPPMKSYSGVPHQSILASFSGVRRTFIGGLERDD